MSGTWYYDQKVHRYRSSSGKFLSKATVVGLRDAFIDKQTAATNELAERLAKGEIDVAAWQKAMRAIIKDTHIAEGLLGIGGKKNATPSFWGRVGRALRTQYDFLARFADEISKGRLSAKQIAYRARLYLRAATATFERAQLTAWGVMATLPQVPGDGQTECSINCRCHLSITETKTSFEIQWVLDPGCQHCRDCPQLARQWNPLVVKK